MDDARGFLAGQGIDVDALVAEVDGRFVSGFIRAVKPIAAPLPRATASEAASCCKP